MTRLYNKSLRDNIFPDSWKRANVSTIFKKGDQHLCNNYRPVSLRSIVGKCLGKCVFKYLFNHIRDNDLLSKFQCGFLPGDGTVRQLVHIYHILSRALDEKKKVRIVFGYNVSLSKVNTRLAVPLLQVYLKARCSAQFYF